MGATAERSRYLISAEVFHEMGDKGLIAPGARIELIEGELITMAPIGSRHASVVNKLNRLLANCGVVSIQNPVRLSGISELQPDAMVLKGDPDDYDNRLPGPQDVVLLIEVSDTTLAFDRGAKADLYAAAGIPAVWIIDVNARSIEVLTEPGNNGYSKREIVTDFVVAPSGVRIAAAAL